MIVTLLPLLLVAALPTADEVTAQSATCQLDPEQVSWQPGLRDIVALYVLSKSEDDPDVAQARKGGACLETWTKSLGLHPVLTVQIPEGH